MVFDWQLVTAAPYAGGNYTFVDIDVGSADADLGTLSAKVGGYVTPLLGFEARAGFGGYATINAVNQSAVTPYGIIGFTRYELEPDGIGLGLTFHF
jgi:hypothetical protein